MGGLKTPKNHPFMLKSTVSPFPEKVIGQAESAVKPAFYTEKADFPFPEKAIEWTEAPENYPFMLKSVIPPSGKR